MKIITDQILFSDKANTLSFTGQLAYYLLKQPNIYHHNNDQQVGLLLKLVFNDK